MSEKKSILTKVAQGVAFGDTSNSAVRNILTEISKELYGKIDDNQMNETMEYFNWCCPYTGRNLAQSVKDRDGSYAADHIYPQNRDWCGLNVRGNLVYVDKKANQAKRGLDVETFLLTDTESIKDIDEIGRTRQQRINNIKAFQEHYKYEPDKIRDIVRPLMEERYKEVREEQEACISVVLAKLAEEGIRPSVVKNTLFDDDKIVDVKDGKGYTYNEKIKVANYYLKNNDGLIQVEEKCMNLVGRKGATAKYILNKLGVDTSSKSTHKGVLLTTDIDSLIDVSEGIFKITLGEIKKRGL